MLQEEMEAREMTQVALAEAMVRSPRLVNEIVRGRRNITADTALALDGALELPATFWLGLQNQYDLSEAMTRRERRAAG
ncbi:MAG: HTH-type transcriptional regulator / antitoxin HigA [Chloroflexi bacterium]|nr:MAG: HTH-type transcriptional regulator / antitoxin HigA [Chloroflexota bacterium]